MVSWKAHLQEYEYTTETFSRIRQSSDTKPESAVFKPEKNEALPPAASSPPSSSSTSSPASPLHNHRGQEHRPQDREDHRIFHTWHHGQVLSKTAPRASTDSLAIDALAFCIYEIFTTYIKILTLALQV